MGHLVPTPIPGVRALESETFLNAWNIEMERRASSLKEEGLEIGLAQQGMLWCSDGCSINAKSLPARAVLAHRARAQPRLGVRGFGCSTGAVCWYHPEGDGITQACSTDHKLGNTAP